ncbi:hypothetical protein MMC07_007184 [Pseudocyphellaria aurata]|nr:hypothetical protein [Pseudocyphellaria aurata]
MASTSDNDVLAPSSLRVSTINHPYGASIASSASSSSSSIFSLESQSSIASSSTSSLNAVWENENEDGFFSNDQSSQESATSAPEHSPRIKSLVAKPIERRAPLPCQPVALEARKHPRRTHRLPPITVVNGVLGTCPRPPPALVRQCERKDNFVDSLVDTTTQMIETIWPLSVLSYSRDTAVDGKEQNLIGLRTFVQEVLRRSKTSYSTLQVALYYLILIQSCIPKRDFTMEQMEDSPSSRAMQCGRRMFLAALILASKYLQDRNFSARAWSKISGLKTLEINTNEMAFLSAVNWKLHIPEPVYNRWTDVVLKYSPSSPSSTSPKSPTSPNMWKSIIPHLTPDLDQFPFGAATVSNDSGYSSPMEPTKSPLLPPIPPVLQAPAGSGSNEQTPTNSYKIPKVLEPTPRVSESSGQILPPLPRLGLLPTPTMTPQTGTFSTPAASAFGLCSGRSSMSIAMAQVQTNCLARSTLDNPNFWKPTLTETFPTSARRSSLARSGSTLSSPESMISDVSTRSSRSSSISSVASSACAPSQPRLAVQATRRCANMKLACQKANGRPLVRLSPSDEASWDGLSDSPDAVSTTEGDYFTRRCPSQPEINAKTPDELVGTHSSSTQEAAAALRDLALNRHRALPCPSAVSNSRKREYPPPESVDGTFDPSQRMAALGSTSASSHSRKRERDSTDLSVQATVRDLIAPRSLGAITNGRRLSEDDGMVLPDDRLADSFMVPKDGETAVLGKISRELPSKACSPRKRSCGPGGSRAEAYRFNRLMMERAARPGMWEGII